MSPDMLLCSLALGVSGEGGEVADMIKKHVFHGHPLDCDKLVKEIGDTLWYLGQLSQAVGWPLSLVAEMNIEKLKKRYPNGFTKQDSIARVDENRQKTVLVYKAKAVSEEELTAKLLKDDHGSVVHIPEQLPPGDGQVSQ